jgi:hypothetical protein
MKKIIVFLLIGSLGFVACINSSIQKDERVFRADTTVITDAYPPINSDVVLDVMESLKVCTSSDTIKTLPPCSNEYFRVFKLGKDKPYENGFILEMKPGLFGTPVKQTLIIQKGFNKYQIINQYLGFLVETRTSETGYNDLLMGYYDQDIGVVAIKHVYDGAKYQPIEVEEINGYFIKEELKDSINHLFIDNFNAGF